MKSKKTNIKIKRSEVNLYNKRKSKKRRIITGVITAVCAVALCILGYGLGKPLVEYFTNKSATSDDSSSAWTPPISESSEISDTGTGDTTSLPNSGDLSASSGVESDSSGATAPAEEQNGKMYFLPDEAALSSSALSSALAAAKDSDCSTVVVVMKNSTGNFLYKSELADIKDTDLITGTLSAKQICDSITKAGFTPAAKISTLKDSKCGSAVEGGYELSTGDGYWMDDSPAKGGKTWLSPFKTQTQQFVGNICEELSSAGFKQIITADTTFPAFHPVDLTTYLNNLPLEDSAKRSAALWNVLDSAKAGAEKNGAEMIIEISGDSVTADSKLCTDGEILSDSAKLSGAKIIVDYTPDSSSDKAYSSAKTFASKLKSALKDADIGVVIKGTSSEAVLSNVEKAFTEQNITVVS